MGWNSQGAASGGITGAASGAMIGLAGGPIGALAGGAIGALAGGFGTPKAGGLEQGYDVVTMPQYSFTEPRLRLASDYLTQNINRMSQGQYPAWYDKASQTMRQQMMTNLNQATYGKPGQRTGTFQQAQDMGAITGIGPKATWAQGQKVLSDYTDKSSQIDAYLAQLGVGVMQGEESTYLQASQNMPQGPQSAIVNKMGGVYGPQGSSPWSTLGQTAAGQGFGNMFSNMFSGGGGSGASQWGYSPSGQYMNTSNPASWLNNNNIGLSGGMNTSGSNQPMNISW